MKKTSSLLLTAAMVLSCFWSVSCIDQEYDLGKEISTVISVGGDSLTVPLIDNGFVRIDQLIDAESIGMLDVDEENGYSISLRDSQAIEGFALDEIEDFIFNYEDKGDPYEIWYASQQSKVEELEKFLLEEFGISIKFASHKEEVVTIDSIVIDKENCWEIDTVFNFPEAILAIDSVTFDESNLVVKVDLNGIPEFAGDLKVKVTVGFPEAIRVSGANAGKGIWVCEKSIHSGDNSISDTIQIQSIRVDNQPAAGQWFFDEDFTCRIQANIKDVKVKVGDLEEGCRISIIPYINLSHLAIKGVYGLIDYTTEVTSMDFKPEWPQELLDGGFRTSLAPYIKLQTRNNFGIPLDIEAEITPKDADGDKQGDTQSFQMSIPRSQSPFGFVNKDFYLCKDGKNTPAGFQFINLDLGDLIDKTPEVIAIDLTASTNKEQRHEYLTHSDYRAFMNYEIGSAIAFGKDAFIQYSDTLNIFDDGSDNSYLEAINDGVRILGEVKNTLPLNMNMILQPIDTENKLIKMEAPVIFIPACQNDGSASVTSLDVKIPNEDGALANIKGLILSLSLSSNEEIEYFPLKPSQGIELNHIALMIEGGITIDLDNLTSAE